MKKPIGYDEEDWYRYAKAHPEATVSVEDILGLLCWKGMDLENRIECIKAELHPEEYDR